MRIRIMKAILIPILIISISSCQNMPQLSAPIERCGIFLEQLGEEIYSGKCRCHQYQIDQENIGRVSESIDYPLNYCKNSIVFRGDSWIELRTWFEELFFWWENMRRKAKRRARP